MHGLALLASAGLQVFLAEKVDVAILEVGIGGRLDATNCVLHPEACGVTPLGFDHVELLGNTLKVRNLMAWCLMPGMPHSHGCSTQGQAVNPGALFPITCHRPFPK